MWYFYFTNYSTAGCIFREIQFSPANYHFITIQYLYVGDYTTRLFRVLVPENSDRIHCYKTLVSTTVASFRLDKIRYESTILCVCTFALFSMTAFIVIIIVIINIIIITLEKKYEYMYSFIQNTNYGEGLILLTFWRRSLFQILAHPVFKT